MGPRAASALNGSKKYALYTSPARFHNVNIRLQAVADMPIRFREQIDRDREVADRTSVSDDGTH
jgi:hypothetical protein